MGKYIWDEKTHSVKTQRYEWDEKTHSVIDHGTTTPVKTSQPETAKKKSTDADLPSTATWEPFESNWARASSTKQKAATTADTSATQNRAKRTFIPAEQKVNPRNIDLRTDEQIAQDKRMDQLKRDYADTLDQALLSRDR